MADKKEQMRIALSDKMSVLQIIGGLIKNPLLFANKDFKFHVDDFPERFHKVVFGAIEYLATQGLAVINLMDIDQFLVKYDVQYKIFVDNSGLTYLKKCIEVADEKKFEYYYKVLKKYSLLNKLHSAGFDITDIIDTSLTDPKSISKMQSKFDNMTAEDIVETYEAKLIGVTQDFNSSNEIIQQEAGFGLAQLVEKYKEAPDMGLPLTSSKCTTLFRGQRLKKFYIESSFQGGGKSRRMAGEAAHLAVPQYYDLFQRRWVNTGLQESVLYISIELDPEELQTLLLAYVSGVPEDHILDGRYQEDEEERVQRATGYIQQASLYLVQVSNFSIEDIENIIKLHKQKYNVRYVYYDYIATSMKIMAEASGKTRISGLREDQILLMMCIRLKELCNRLNIHIRASTQLSGDWKNTKDPDQSLLRGAKAIADKSDIGSILLTTRESDQDIINLYLQKGFSTTPNLVLHCYKIRRGKARKDVKVYLYFDYATCRTEDCFVTDEHGVIIDVEDTNIEIISEDEKNKQLASAVDEAPFEF